MPSALRFAQLALPSLLLTVFASPAAAQSRVPGWLYTTSITFDSGTAAKRSSMAMRYQVIERNLRMEWVHVSGISSSGADLGSIEGMYTILNGADSTMTMVIPSQHIATVIGMAGLVPPQAVMSTKPHITQNRIEDLGAGERILGHVTRHFRVTRAGTMDITTQGQTCSRRVDGVSEAWIAPDVDLLPAMKSAMGHYGISGALGDGAQQTPDAATSTLPKGTPLRMVMRETSVDGRGAPKTITTTIEYVEISQAPIDPAVFQVPADYNVMDMRKMMSTMPAGMMDSAMKANQAAGAKAMCGTTEKP